MCSISSYWDTIVNNSREGNKDEACKETRKYTCTAMVVRQRTLEYRKYKKPSLVVGFMSSRRVKSRTWVKAWNSPAAPTRARNRSALILAEGSECLWRAWIYTLLEGERGTEGRCPHCPFPSTPVGFPFLGHALSLLYLSIMLVGEEHVIRKLFFLVRRTADSWKEARMQKQ